MLAPLATFVSLSILAAAAPSKPPATAGARDAVEAPAEQGTAQTPEDAVGKGGQWHFSEGRKQRRERKKAQSGPQLPQKNLKRPPISSKGRYQGLRLESKALAPIPTKLDPDGAPVLTWVGFQRDVGNRSVVFVQTDQGVEPTLTQKGRLVEVFLPGVAVTQVNHTRPLDLRYFPQTPVRGVMAKSDKDGVRIKIRLRKRVKAQLTQRPGLEGHAQVLVSFD